MSRIRRVFTLLPCHLATLSFLTLAHPVQAGDSAEHKIEVEGQVDKSQFPTIKFRFQVIDREGKALKNLPEQEVIVREDGQEVYRKSQRLRAEPIGLVLVIDTSGSMSLPADRQEYLSAREGKLKAPIGQEAVWRTKLDEAKRAARRFFERLDPATPCGLVLFNHEVRAAEPVRVEKEKLQVLVEQAKADGATGMYDAMTRAVELFSDDRKWQRAIVLMTDGREESKSKLTPEDVVARARQSGVRIYTIGLGTTSPTPVGDKEELVADLDEATLKRLAEQTGGRYFHVLEADKLAEVFDRLAGQLQDSYEVSFRSLRAFHDGTSRGLEVRFGDLATGKLGYTTHGLITPVRDHAVYLTLLAALVLMLVLPSMLRRARAG